MGIEAMKEALEVLETPLHAQPWGLKQNAIVALRTAIDAELEQAMVEVWQTAPRQWVGLTDEEIKALYDKHATYQEYDAWESGWFEFAVAFEAKLKEKNSD